MKKIFTLFMAALLLLAVSLFAQQKRVVLLKFNQQNDLLRIVFEGEETLINRIKVTTSPSQIKMDFPEPFELQSQKDLPFEIKPSDKTVVIDLKGKVEIKFFRLSAPARLVLDIQKREQAAEQQPAKPQEKTAEQQAPASQPRKIVIDPGHGGFDFGITEGNITEKDLSLAIAKDLGAALAKKGKKVYFIRKADQHVSIADRIHSANQKEPDIFISLHASLSQNFNLYEPNVDEQIPGDYSIASSQKRYVGKSKLLSDSIEKAIRDEFDTEVLRRKMPLPLLHSVGAPAVFLEFPSPKFFTYDQQMKTRLTNAIVQGMHAYGF